MEQIIFVSGGLLIFLLAVGWVLAHWSKQIASCLPSEDGGMIGAEGQAHGRV